MLHARAVFPARQCFLDHGTGRKVLFLVVLADEGVATGADKVASSDRELQRNGLAAVDETVWIRCPANKERPSPPVLWRVAGMSNPPKRDGIRQEIVLLSEVVKL